MKYLPNFLTLYKLPVAVIILLFTAREQWSWAAVLLLAALATDGLDGFTARKLGAESKLGEVMDPICDFAVTSASLAGLYLTEKISVRSVVIVVVVACALQIAHSTPFSKHSYWIHPLMSMLLLWAIGFVFIILAFGGPDTVGKEAMFCVATLWGYNLVWCVGLYLKRFRIAALFAGPPHS